MADLQAPSRKLSPAQRWFNDGLLVCQVPAIHTSLEVDVSGLPEVLQHARSAGLRLTYTHIFVRAVALVLRENPKLRTILCGSRLHTPETVDIGLSIGSDDAVTPVLIVKAADRKLLPAVAEEIIRRTPEARAGQEALLANLNRWGWIVPLPSLRRVILRLLGQSAAFRRAGSGTFQVSIVRDVDQADTNAFNTGAMLMAGEVKERVCVHHGQPTVRLTVILTCIADHRVWNGGDCALFLQQLRNVLTSGQMANEFNSAALQTV